MKNNYSSNKSALENLHSTYVYSKLTVSLIVFRACRELKNLKKLKSKDTNSNSVYYSNTSK